MTIPQHLRKGKKIPRINVYFGKMAYILSAHYISISDKNIFIYYFQ